MVRPMPRPAPVTNAIFPAKEFVTTFIHFVLNYRIQSSKAPRT